MLIEKIEDLCTRNGTNITALCKEITGSSGNLPTWRKDKIRPDWLKAICLKFNISSDYLLSLPMCETNYSSELSQEERACLVRFNRLNPDNQIKAQSYMINLYEKQEENKSFKDKIEDWLTDEDSVAADESLGKTGTTNSAK